MQPTNFTLITGASLGFGKALALDCAKRGWNLILVALPSTGLPDLAVEIRRSFGVVVETMELDLCNTKSCEEVFRFVKSKSVTVNVLINNLGGGSTELFATGHLEEYESQIELNVLSTVRVSYLFIAALKHQLPAHILNVGSLAAYFTVPQKAVYSASKAFILSFSKTLREELRESNINVSVVCPSGMPTNDLSAQMIRSGNLVTRLSCMTPEAVARIAISGMLDRKQVIIPGAVNRFFLLLDKILPLFLKRVLLNNRMGRLKNSSSSASLLEPIPVTEATLTPVAEVLPLKAK